MAQIKNEKEYNATMARIEELLPKTWSDTESDDSLESIELSILSELAAEYEDTHYPIASPSLIDTIKLRMYEMNLTQKDIAQMLDISAPRLSEIMHGKAEPSLSLAKKMCIKLNISPSVVLGV